MSIYFSARLVFSRFLDLCGNLAMLKKNVLKKKGFHHSFYLLTNKSDYSTLLFHMQILQIHFSSLVWEHYFFDNNNLKVLIRVRGWCIFLTVNELKNSRKYAHLLQKNYLALEIINACLGLKSTYSRGREDSLLLPLSYKLICSIDADSWILES